jgi:hypothetical protein
MIQNAKYILLILITTSVCIAQETVSVTVSGYGATPDAAEKSAIQKAVRKALGEFVDAETITNNEVIIKDEVLTYSDGFVGSKKILAGPEKDPDLGLFVVTIEAKVVRNKLIQRLRDSKISVSAVSGDDLWTQAISKVASIQDGRALLNKFLNEEMPAEKLVSAEVISRSKDGKVVRGKNATPSQKPNYDNNTVELTFHVELSYDLEAFYKKAVPRLISLLDKVCISVVESDVFVNLLAGSNNSSSAYGAKVTAESLYPAFYVLDSMGFTFSDLYSKIYFGNSWNKILTKDEKADEKAFVAVNLAADSTGMRQKFKIYQLEAAAYQKILDTCLPRILPPLHLSIESGGFPILREEISLKEIPLTDSKSKLMRVYTLRNLNKDYARDLWSTRRIDYRSQKQCGPVYVNKNQRAPYSYNIAPWFVCGDYYSQKPVFVHKTIVSDDDLKKIDQVSLNWTSSKEAYPLK